MKKIVLSTVALFAMTSFAAAAEPLRLTDTQMDAVTAGQTFGDGLIVNVSDINVVVPVNAQVAANILSFDEVEQTQDLRPGRLDVGRR
jgi:hypothetical protein